MSADANDAGLEALKAAGDGAYRTSDAMMLALRPSRRQMKPRKGPADTNDAGFEALNLENAQVTGLEDRKREVLAGKGLADARCWPRGVEA